MIWSKNCVLPRNFLHSYRNKDIKQDLVKEWLEDDFEWPQQKKTYSGTKKTPHKIIKTRYNAPWLMDWPTEQA